jgi:molybdenum cofactor cytidylyltransferase
MNSEHKLCGVILAAGRSSRMGTEKALLPWPPARTGEVTPGGTLLSGWIAALKTRADAAIVVAGRNAGALAPVVCGCGALLVVNPDPDRGQFSSLQTGLREVVACGYGAAMITPVDCPPLAAATLERLDAAFEQALAAGKWAVEPENNGRHGHPMVAGRALIEAILSAPVTERLINMDMNTPEEYAARSSEAEAGF